jgi:hypothetical protein
MMTVHSTSKGDGEMMSTCIYASEARRLACIVLCAMLAHCASAKKKSTGEPVVPASGPVGEPTAETSHGGGVEPPASAPCGQPERLDSFLEAAKKMGLEYNAPAGYCEVEIVDNMDVSYDYGVLDEDKGIEMRFALRPYSDDTPPPMKSSEFSWIFFTTAIMNITHGGETGESAPPEPLPLDHLGADDAKVVAVRWNKDNNEEDFFGNGYDGCIVIYMHRDGLGDAYTFVLFKDVVTFTAEMDEDKMHTLRFAPEAPPDEAGQEVGGDACEAYARCCFEYVDTLGAVEGVPEASVKATRDGCKQIEDLRGQPGAQDACKQALDALKGSMEAMKAMPGFEIPPACK